MVFGCGERMLYTCGIICSEIRIWEQDEIAETAMKHERNKEVSKVEFEVIVSSRGRLAANMFADCGLCTVRYRRKLLLDLEYA